MDGGVVETELRPIFLFKLGRIAVVAIMIRRADGQVGIAVRTADILVKERLGHEFSYS